MPFASVRAGDVGSALKIDLQVDAALCPLRIKQPSAGAQCVSVEPNNDQDGESTFEFGVPHQRSHGRYVRAARLNSKARVAVPLADIVILRIAMLYPVKEPDGLAGSLHEIDDKAGDCT